MFPGNYFASSYFAPYYWTKAGRTVNPFRIIPLVGLYAPNSTLAGN